MSLTNQYFFIILACLSMLVITGCSHSPALDTGEEVTVESHSFSFTPPDFGHLDEYKLSPGDVLDVLFQIQTWHPELAYRISLGDTVSVTFPDISELNHTQKVLPDGTISLPYLGVVSVYNKTPTEISEELKLAYKDILVSPNLYVTVPEYLSQVRELKTDLHTSARGLSRLVTIRPDGYVTFPMIGDVFVASKSIFDINSQINKEYSSISSSLHVDLFLEHHSGAKIYMLGEVTRPGAYDITKPISIMQAMALAQGHTKNALLDEAYIIRRKGKQMIATRVNVSDTMNLVSNASYFYLLPDDIVYIPATPLSDAAHIAQQVADVLFFRGWGAGLSWEINP